jgi:DNA mismatch repair protein MutL
MGSIRVLPPETARLIAAGEVIDRPASALRELVDNAIDSGATELSIRIEEGGIGLLRVVDDGSGMSREDLELSILPHATSKIRTADDLLWVRSLGFRGEALASIAAASRLEITSKDSSSPSAHRLVSEPGSAPRMEACAGRRGTIVSATGLFKDFPARRQFLKRPQAEAALCRQVYEDKALAHPLVGFRFESGAGAPEILKAGSLLGRVSALHDEAPFEFLHDLGFSGAGFEGRVVIAGPSFSRPDRRLMQAFVNRRRVQDWGLLGALDYAFSGYLPGGLHPIAFLFLEMDPALADFNIHPAKKEVRFKDPDSPRRAIISAIQAFLSELARRDPAQSMPDPLAILGSDASSEPELELVPASLPSGQPSGGQRGGGWPPYPSGGAIDSARPDWSDFDQVRERAAAGQSPNLPPARLAPDFRYLGRALGPFLVFEREDAIWFLDQHAAHERMLFDELCARPPESQELLVPETVEGEGDEDDRLLGEAAPRLAEAGFRLEREVSSWLVAAAPAALAKGAAAAALEIAREGGDALRAARAMAACRAAVKDGDELDDQAAEALIARALALPEPRCPHGRPIWTRVTREQLYRLVRRDI